MMNQSFILKHHGHLDLFEQSMMTAEDRRWWIERLEKEVNKDKSNQPMVPKAPKAPPKK